MSMQSLVIFLFCLAGVAHGCQNADTANLPINLADAIERQNGMPWERLGPVGPARTPSDLNCGFGIDEKCAWRNVRGDDLDWDAARLRNVPDNIWRQYTGQAQRPDDWFAGVAQITNDGRPKKAILEAEVPCQQGDARLSFDHWGSSDADNLQVCTVTRSGVENCSPPITRASGVRTTQTIRSPGNDPFLIQIRGQGLAQQSFMAIDNVKYDGNFCGSGPSNSSTSSPGTVIGPTGGSQSCQLSCDFEQLNTCGWSPIGQGGRGQWNVIQGRVGNPATGIREGAGGNGAFAFVGGEGNIPQQNFVLESPQIKLDQPMDLTFDEYQRLAKTSLQVCVDSPSNCPYTSPPLSGNTFWQTNQRAQIPAGTHKIYFIAQNVGKLGYVGLDNIKASGNYQCV